MRIATRRWLLVTCLTLVIPAFAGAERPKKVAFKPDQPFTFNFGDTAEGPDGLSIWFSGAGLDNDGNIRPSFTFKRDSRTLDQPLWSGRSVRPPVRALLGKHAITVLKVAQKKPHATTLVVSRYTPATMKWGAPITLSRHEFVVDPDGTLWTFAASVDAGRSRIRLLARRKGTADDHTEELRPGKRGTFGPRDWGDLLITARISRGTVKRPRAIRLKLSKPKETFKSLKLGRPIVLRPRESVRGSGFTLTLNGYGHKIARSGDILTVDVTVKQGSQEGFLVFFPSRGKKRSAPQKWGSWSIALRGCNDHGPPHSMTATSTFVVRKSR